jgi:purine-nucleoside phosphorylase
MSKVISFRELTDAVRTSPPAVALVLGSGLDGVAQSLCDAGSVFFSDVPGLTGAGVAGHRGCVTLGQWGSHSVLIFEGRLHYYEGHPWRTVTQPIQIARHLGASILLATNAAGGIHDALTPGSLMALSDHVEWTRPHAWRLPGPGGLGERRPSPYSPGLLQLLQQAAARRGLALLAGTYAQVPGPSYETKAEIRALRAWGVDAVGMSTACEIEAAHGLGMECAALSCITNRAAGLGSGPIHHDEVLAIGNQLADATATLIHEFLDLLRDTASDGRFCHA